jgi:hypothetical protein
MISRTSIIAAVFAVLGTVTLFSAAEQHVRHVDTAVAAPTVAVVHLPTVVVTAKRA